jgi:hypothetical protein
MGVSYAPCSLPGSEASEAAIKKWKAKVSKKPTAKQAKAGANRATPSKMVSPPPVGVSKMFHLLDVAASSYGFHAVGVTVTHIARVPAFNNLSDDTSPNDHGTPPPKRTKEKHAFLLPPVSGEFLHLSFILLRQALMATLQVLLDFHPR